jgi:hypothetical protein
MEHEPPGCKPSPPARDDGEITRTYVGGVAPSPPEASQDIVRYGPGVPAIPPPGQPGLAAERVWHPGGTARPPSGWRKRWRRLASAALTVALLAASAVVLFARFHHPPFHVTTVAITHEAKDGCVVDVTGRIGTNGAAGTVSYQWLFRSDQQAPQPLNQSVAAGQRAVYVTVALEGSGQGTATQEATLQVLGPEFRSASADVPISC